MIKCLLKNNFYYGRSFKGQFLSIPFFMFLCIFDDFFQYYFLLQLVHFGIFKLIDGPHLVANWSVPIELIAGVDVTNCQLLHYWRHLADPIPVITLELALVPKMMCLLEFWQPFSWFCFYSLLWFWHAFVDIERYEDSTMNWMSYFINIEKNRFRGGARFFFN